MAELQRKSLCPRLIDYLAIVGVRQTIAHPRHSSGTGGGGNGAGGGGGGSCGNNPPVQVIKYAKLLTFFYSSCTIKICIYMFLLK